MDETKGFTKLKVAGS